MQKMSDKEIESIKYKLARRPSSFRAPRSVIADNRHQPKRSSMHESRGEHNQINSYAREQQHDAYTIVSNLDNQNMRASDSNNKNEIGGNDDENSDEIIDEAEDNKFFQIYSNLIKDKNKKSSVITNLNMKDLSSTHYAFRNIGDVAAAAVISERIRKGSMAGGSLSGSSLIKPSRRNAAILKDVKTLAIYQQQRREEQKKLEEKKKEEQLYRSKGYKKSLSKKSKKIG
jgi:hypothetical protein